jgi:hypothetical protein
MVQDGSFGPYLKIMKYTTLTQYHYIGFPSFLDYVTLSGRIRPSEKPSIEDVLPFHTPNRNSEPEWYTVPLIK